MIKISTDEVPDGFLSKILLVYSDGKTHFIEYCPAGYPLKGYIMEITLKKRRKKRRNSK